jgi:hypothetical protein
MHSENREMIELRETSCGHSGRGLSRCAMSVAIRPRSDSNAKRRLKVSEVHPFLHNRTNGWTTRLLASAPTSDVPRRSGVAAVEKVYVFAGLWSPWNMIKGLDATLSTSLLVYCTAPCCCTVKRQMRILRKLEKSHDEDL